ncbi:Ldh family oxidoreductase [Falsiroseomonas stagni]|uniref:Ureidoglycolate dehydrogenase (NAD+) n=1 Tax=Falsiroseomonas stagni DSM 19981 TaxID=1123062 RepID=A0A1I4B8B8_9PROT|nr:Ldh family oxidoreductase [Falsiroseomonas stagni]SFK65025.1 ureidoglycolate dehydrogenase (NAD+) [Falsiroseomonas stagni DSM 19981]
MSRIRIAAPALQTLARDILAAAGTPHADAEVWAETLVFANLRGVDSHGVIRIPRYLEQIGTGDIRPAAGVRLLKSAGAIALLDAAGAPGPVAMKRAMEEAIAAAKRVHVGWCVARNITHAGAVGHFALQAAEAGMAGLVMTASIPLMAWPGSRKAVVSTNPVAIAMPGGKHPPLLLDMATATVSLGKILGAKQAGTPIPEGWGIDSEGADTTDAAKVATLLPMAGPKGAGLSLMIECLTSLVATNPVIAPALRGEKSYGMNGVAIALDLAAFGDPAELAASVDDLAATVAAQPRAAGTDALLVPGERGDAERARRLADGIPLPPGAWKQLVEAATRLGVEVPALL